MSVVRDPALPRLERLLDAEAMIPVLARSLGRPGPVDDARGVYLRYKPRTNLRVHYEVRLGGRRHGAVVMIAAGADLARRARKAANVALARVAQDRAPAAMPLSHDAELDALVQWLLAAKALMHA